MLRQNIQWLARRGSMRAEPTSVAVVCCVMPRGVGGNDTNVSTIIFLAHSYRQCDNACRL